MNTKQLLRDMYDTTVRTAHPEQCLAKHLPDLTEYGQVIILGAGKASASMVCALEAHYEKTGDTDKLSGFAVTRYGYTLPTRYIKLMEAAHPIPDNNSTQAAMRALELAKSATKEDLVIVLLSGGASALWTAPVNGITLQQKQLATEKLLKCGATISEINTVRKHLSAIKGGHLATAAYPAQLLTLAISDVPHDDISIIGSGPTVHNSASIGDAQNIIQKYQLDLPFDITTQANTTPVPTLNNKYHLIATPGQALSIIKQKLEAMEYKTVLLDDSLEGEAREIGEQHARIALTAKDNNQKTAFLSGGELTVTVNGTGTGGPNQEYLLSLAIALDGAPGITAIAADTDGSDGGTGVADDPAGAFIDPSTLKRASQLDLNPAAFLDNNDSGGFFARLDDLLTCGPTQTNINDFRLILVNPPSNE